jgi:hypothetical protein
MVLLYRTSTAESGLICCSKAPLGFRVQSAADRDPDCCAFHGGHCNDRLGPGFRENETLEALAIINLTLGWLSRGSSPLFLSGSSPLFLSGISFAPIVTYAQKL